MNLSSLLIPLFWVGTGVFALVLSIVIRKEQRAEEAHKKPPVLLPAILLITPPAVMTIVDLVAWIQRPAEGVSSNLYRMSNGDYYTIRVGGPFVNWLTHVFGPPLAMILLGSMAGMLLTLLWVRLFPTRQDLISRDNHRRQANREKEEASRKKALRDRTLAEEGEYIVRLKLLHLKAADQQGRTVFTRQEAEKLVQELKEKNVEAEVLPRKCRGRS